jgi:xanthine dehydrogenase accessory factor
MRDADAALHAEIDGRLGCDHAADVLGFAEAVQAAGRRVALVVVTGTEGGGVRAPGALMAVAEDGARAGYITNGCVDADAALQARAVLESGRPRALRYGEGSPFRDIRLPCGGAIDLLAAPDPDPVAVRAAAADLRARRPAGLLFGPDGSTATPAGKTGWRGDVFAATWEPKVRVRVAGRGAETLALARLALASGFEAVVQSPDEDCLEAAAALGAHDVVRLTTPEAPPEVADDPWTAFVLMFHDHEWEADLIVQALAGEAFFVGALGSRKTQARRRETLAERGVAQADIDRVRGPVGLVPALRDASAVAVSALAEIVAAHQQRTEA